MPRRAGDRGALEAGCLPSLLPGGRPVADAAARVDVAAAWGVDSLPDGRRPRRRRASSPPPPPASSAAWWSVASTSTTPPTRAPPAPRSRRRASWSALELRETDVTRAADVVFPVAPVTEKAGTFVNWEGRLRPFEAVLTNPGSLPDLRVLAGIAEELGRPLGFRTVAEAAPRWSELGAWDGERRRSAGAEAATAATPSGLDHRGRRRSRSPPGSSCIDDGSMQDGEPHLRATARHAGGQGLRAPRYDAARPRPSPSPVTAAR